MLSAQPAARNPMVLSTQPCGSGAPPVHSLSFTPSALISSCPGNRMAAVTARDLLLVHNSSAH